MRGPAPPPESAEMVREVLLKLPTKDVARCRCVCKLWRGVVAEPTFNSLHAETETNGNHVSAASEALLVTETREHGRPEEASFSIVSTLTPAHMSHRITIPGGYSLSNVCNGLLCFAIDYAEAPAFICNPVTGETTTLPTPMGVSIRVPGVTVFHHYALGFSPSSKEHKLFRFSFSPSNSTLGNKTDQSVCTLGGGGGWRQRSYTSQSPLMRTLPPVLVDGSLYLVTSGRTFLGQCQNPDEMLVVDVATEAHRTCRLPIGAEEFHSACDPQVNAFEMSGRLCLAVKTVRRKFQLWVMSLPPPDQWVEGDDSKLWWDLCYSFRVNGASRFNVKMEAWFDDGTLCFRHGDVLFKHDTRGRSPEPSPDTDCPQCDRRLQLPPTPSNCKCNIIGGYRPSLLSPLTLATPPSSWDGEEERQEFHHAMFLAVRRNCRQASTSTSTSVKKKRQASTSLSGEGLCVPVSCQLWVIW